MNSEEWDKVRRKVMLEGRPTGGLIQLLMMTIDNIIEECPAAQKFNSDPFYQALRAECERREKIWIAKGEIVERKV
jgi:hypothetical protein